MSKKETQKKSPTKNKKAEEAQRVLPALDFSSLVLPFYTQALIKLGMVSDPVRKKQEEDLELAKRLIDLLDLLKERTKGNLKPEEETFLTACLQQLKMGYMERAKIITL